MYCTKQKAIMVTCSSTCVTDKHSSDPLYGNQKSYMSAVNIRMFTWSHLIMQVLFSQQKSVMAPIVQIYCKGSQTGPQTNLNLKQDKWSNCYLLTWYKRLPYCMFSDADANMIVNDFYCILYFLGEITCGVMNITDVYLQ